MLTGPLGTDFNGIVIKIHIFFQENSFENVVLTMAAILSRSQCVNTSLAIALWGEHIRINQMYIIYSNYNSHFANYVVM